MKVDLFHPYVPKEAIEAVTDCMRSRFIGQGPRVEQFERSFMDFFGVRDAVSLSSGTAALETAYDLIGIGQGDEVITTPLTCTATNLLLLRRGASIVWADIDPKTLCIDPDDVHRKITPATKAIVQVHLGGIEARVPAAFYNKNYQIPVVSDAAQALGIFSGDYTCCSFQAIKHITTGDGGMLMCRNPEEAKTAKMLRWFGIDREKKIANNWQAYKERKMTFDIEVAGTKRHMTDMAAAMGLVGLDHYWKVIHHRSMLAVAYKGMLQGLNGITVVDGPNNTWWLLTVLVDRRDDFARVLFEADIDSNVVQVRNDIYKIFGGQRAELPVMNQIEEQYLSLPLGMHVTLEDVQYICDVIKKGW